MDKIGDTSYHTIVTCSNWTETEAAYVALGGHVITINDANEQSYLDDVKPNKNFWMGLTDPDGLKYWIGNFSFGIYNARSIAFSFLLSSGFAKRHRRDVCDTKCVETLYLNFIGRDYNQSGFNYWLGKLNHRLNTFYELLLGIAESTENKALFAEITVVG